ncbi:MAG TPA: hypothetical protein VFC78_14165 [Tepidisphaeraceae bacterium]|nr:hypothetical protein [Tepidisphaeraceae bacterium]
MNRIVPAGVACAAFLAAMALHQKAGAHGFAGDRFFPPTIATDDPFAVDEFAFPTVSYARNRAADGSPGNREIDAGFEFDKEIFPRLALGISDRYTYQDVDHRSSIHGWDNLAVTAKYEILIHPEHEFIVSLGLESDIGGAGARSVGSDTFSTFTPKLYLGKGFGDLPDSVDLFKPFALTAELGQSFPTRADNSNTFQTGFALEYSLPYLEQNVRDTGLPRPFRDLIPLVEFSFETAENRAGGGLTTGTINPGVLYENPYFQLGLEANIPINRRSGSSVGFTIQAWIYLDDIFPRVFGHPLFGE